MRHLPKISLVWMYEGEDLDDRRKTVVALDYPDVEVINPDKEYPLEHLVDLMSEDSEICVFWSDDGKPVSSEFLKLMVQPLLAEANPQILMHLWSGNAVAMRREALESVQKGMFRLVGSSFMKLAIFFLEIGSDVRGARSQVVVSPTEKLAPLCAEHIGRVC
jgi:hypothetical protein